jgi:flagellar export protein FliJ
MAAFKFRLEAVLRLRARIKEERQWELRALYETRHRLEAEIDALEEALRATGDALAGRDGEFLSVVDLKLVSEYAQLIEQRIKLKAAALAKLDNEIVEKRRELVEALRGLKSLERLRERRAEKFRREQDAAEQKFVDEIARRTIGAASAADSRK